MIRLAFLASNNGTSLRAIIAAIEAGELDATAVLAVSNRKGALALTFAAESAIPTKVIATLPDPDIADERLLEALGGAKADLVILSGYLRRLGPKTLTAFANRILNVHPALLPRHGGTGMYGRRVHEAVLASGDRVSGASVHLVDGEYDHGRVIARVEVPVLSGDTAETLERRVMAAEPELFVQTLRQIANGECKLE
ncbi:MAG TPA: phosphoribosylglycinamide formyltransferase [Caulobacteraceae bacterium]|jgi:phosphoribosylglycinamide formyltransferase-1